MVEPGLDEGERPLSGFPISFVGRCGANWVKRHACGWQHEVAGEHGKPSYGAFSIEHFNLCRQEIIEYQKITITDSELRDCDSEEASHDRLEMLLNLMPRTGVFWIGGDLGYTNDPTELVVFQEIDIGERKILKMILRLHMEHVTYPHIAQTIALLERYFTPVVPFRGFLLAL